MDFLVVALVVFLFIAFLFFLGAFKIIQQGHCGLVTRLGSYLKTIPPGLHIIIPVVDSLDRVVDLREQVLPLESQSVITSDNVNINVDAVIYYQIMNPYAAIYEINNIVYGIQQLALTSIRNLVGEMTLDETLTSRELVNTKLQEIMDKAANKWGAKTNRVELKDVNPPPEIQRAMNVQMEAERNRRAAILDAEGDKESKILRAEGDKQAVIKAAEAEAAKLKLEVEAKAHTSKTYIEYLNEAAASPEAMQLVYMDTLKNLANGKANKIFLPQESLTLAANVAAAGELFRESKSSKPTPPPALN